MQKSALYLASLLILAGCSIPGVYKIDVQQGNVIEQEMIDKLRPGMTKRQVRYIMGTPLIIDTFEPDRWDYVYSYQPGGGKRVQEQISLLFADGKLANFIGHFRPSSAVPDEPDTAQDPDETGNPSEGPAMGDDDASGNAYEYQF